MDIQEKIHVVANLTVGGAAVSLPWALDKVMDTVHIITSLLGLVLVIAQLIILFKKQK